MAKKSKDKAETQENGTDLGRLARIINEIPSERAEHESDQSQEAGGTSEGESEGEPKDSHTEPTSDPKAGSGSEASGL